MDIPEWLLRRYILKIFSRSETFLQSSVVATSKLLILHHLVFSTNRLILALNFLYTGIYSALLIHLMERTSFESKR